MSTTNDERQGVAASEQSCGLAALPQPLLDQILLSDRTTTKDKKALRQTCKLFKQTLDSNMTCVKLDGWTKPDECKDLERLLTRLQHSCSFRKADFEMCINYKDLLNLLPSHITTLSLTGLGLDVKDLARLPCLTSLCVYGMMIVRGMECISGLTRLYLNSSNVSLSHLAPTLKQLSVWSYDDVEDINQLTNLEVLELRGRVSEEFFEQCRQLPLQRLSIQYQDYNYDYLPLNDQPWSVLPTTLTHLTLGCHECPYPFEHVSSLPEHITHLQLSLGRASTLPQVAKTLPGLRSLDIVWRVFDYRLAGSASNLSNLTNLQTLNVCFSEFGKAANDGDGADDRADAGGVCGARAGVDAVGGVGNGIDAHTLLRLKHMSLFIKEAIQAQIRGVKVNLVTDVKELEATWSAFYDLCSMETAWARPA